MIARTAPDLPDGAAMLARQLQAVAGGDRAAVAELYQRTSGKLYGVCLRMLAEDALQDSHPNVWRAGSFRCDARDGDDLVDRARPQPVHRPPAPTPRAPLDDVTSQRLSDPDPDSSGERIQPAAPPAGGLPWRLAEQQRHALRAAFFPVPRTNWRTASACRWQR